jgi:hypothetical protein
MCYRTLAIISLTALDGGIDAYRSERERTDGKWDERDEVFM